MGLSQGCCGVATADQKLFVTAMPATEFEQSRASTSAPSPELGDWQWKNKEELRDIFLKFDSDGNGFLDVAEMAEILMQLGLQFSAAELKSLMKVLSQSDTQKVPVEKLICFVSKMEKTGVDLGTHLKNTIAELDVSKQEKAIDVFILYRMAPARGHDFAWWISSFLDRWGFNWSGQHVKADLEQIQESCKCILLLLDSTSLIHKPTVEVLAKASANDVYIRCVYDAREQTWNDLSNWRNACPQAFKLPALAVSRYFPRSSEDVVRDTVASMLRVKVPPQPSGEIVSDHDDFSDLGSIEGIRWMKPEFLMAVKSAEALDELPAQCFGVPGRARPFYVSFAFEDSSTRAPSERQLVALRNSMRELPIAGSLFFLETLNPQLQPSKVVRTSNRSNPKQPSIDCGTQFCEVLSLCRFLIFDQVPPDAQDTTPYLSRGRCFMEAAVAVITGNLAPSRPNQLEELDDAIGQEVAASSTLHQIITDNAGTPEKVIGSLCTVLATKVFRNTEEAEEIQRIFRKVLERHPLFLQNATAG